MTTAYSNLLGLALPVTGELSGTWGDTVNDYITKYLDDAIANAQIISGSQTAVTLSKTTGSSLVSAGSGATGSAQYALIRCTGNPASTLTITVSYSSLTNAQFSKTYLIFNSTSTSQSVVVQATTSSGTSTGVTITSGEKALIAWNGTDFVKIATQSGTGEFVTVDTTNLEVTNIKAKDGTAAATIADSTGAITVSTILNVDNLRLDTNTISSTDTNGNIVLAPNGTGDVQLDADTVRVGDSNVNVTITSNGTADLILNTNAGTNSGSITIEDGANGNIIIAPNGTGQVQISNAALDLTTIEVTNIKAKDGTASMTLADSTGVVTFSANPVLNAGTANGVPYLNASKVLTTGSALTFDGTTFAVNSAASIGSSTAKTKFYSDSTYNGIFNGASLTSNESIYMGGGNQFFYASGSELMRLTSTGLKSSIAGTNADPVFSYTSDTNTGIFFPAADKLGFVAGGGADQMVLTSTGLGIGASSPGSKLDVLGGVSSTSDWGNVNITSRNAINSANRIYAGLRFQDSGASDAGAIGYSYNGTGYNMFFGTVASVGGAVTTRLAITSTGEFQWKPDGTTQAMTLDASGNLGVGTTSVISGARADIRGANANSLTDMDAQVLTVFDTTAYAQNVGGGIAFGYKFNSSNSYIQRGAVIKAAKENATDGNYATALVFGTAPNGASTVERARITSGGYFKASNDGTYYGSTSAYHELRSSTTYTATANLTHTSPTSPYGIIVRYTAASPNNTDNWFLYCEDSGGTQRASIKSNGGFYNYQANDSNLSDRREKTNFAPAKSYLDAICAIPVQTFNYIDQSEDDPGLTLGVVAQDVQAVAPELINESNWGTKDSPKMRLSIYQTDLQYALMKCIQEQQAIINDLRARVAALEAN